VALNAWFLRGAFAHLAARRGAAEADKYRRREGRSSASRSLYLFLHFGALPSTEAR
jgi:hypothetical protein